MNLGKKNNFKKQKLCKTKNLNSNTKKKKSKIQLSKNLNKKILSNFMQTEKFKICKITRIIIKM